MNESARRRETAQKNSTARKLIPLLKSIVIAANRYAGHIPEGRLFLLQQEKKKQQKVNNHQTLVAVEIAIIGSEMDFDFDRKTKKHASG